MNAQRFKEIFIPYHQKLYRIAYRIIEDTYLAEDLVQDTYVKLWSQRDRLKSIQNMEAYAVIVLRNSCMDYIKQNKKEQKIKQMTEKPIVVENADWTDEAEFIKKIIDALPQQQKIAFWMKHWEEYPNKVIEETLGVSAVNLRVILSRARKTIKDQFLQWKRI